MQRNISRVNILVWPAFVLLVISLFLPGPSVADDFREGWETTPSGIFAPDAIISGDEGTWILTDTVSEFPEDCGTTPHRAEILSVDGSKALKLISSDSNSSCSDNVWVVLEEIVPFNLNIGFSISLDNDTLIAFKHTGALVDPQSGSPNCLVVPCGDTISLMLSDNNGNVLAYLLQRAPDAVPNVKHSNYREVFLDPSAGEYVRNLFDDFSTIQAFTPNGAEIKSIEYKIQEHGWGIIDDIIVTTDQTIKPLLAGFSVNPTSGTAPLNVNFTDESKGIVTSWNWNFGDGATSTIQKPSHTYTYEGKYSVSLAVTGPYGSDTETKTDYISVARSSGIKEFKIRPSDSAPIDYFGNSVSISGEYAIVGAYFDDDNGTNSGSAYIFERSGSSWNQVAKLTASDGATYDTFGYSVSISGGYAIVNAFRDDDNGTESGSAYIFEKSGSNWNQVAKLTASDGAEDDFFGYDVSISGGYAIVSANSDDDNGTNSGSAYIFEKSGSNWNQVAKLTANDAAAYNYFGNNVSISSGGYAIVGAWLDNDNGEGSGSAYIFEKSGSNWNQVAKLTASDAAASDYFGSGVSISGGYAIVSANYDDDNGTESGSAYIFERSGSSWNQVAKLTASDAAASDLFGQSVSISGGYVIVGAMGDEANSGSAYFFNLSIPSDIAMPWIPLLMLDD